VAKTAIRKAPKDTGRLVGAISAHVVDGPGGPYAEVRCGVDYAIYQEYGTRYQSGTPFMRPALGQFARRVGGDR
jgi:HK97 gp10 family phage protein